MKLVDDYLKSLEKELKFNKDCKSLLNSELAAYLEAAKMYRCVPFVAVIDNYWTFPIMTLTRHITKLEKKINFIRRYFVYFTSKETSIVSTSH